MNSWQMIFYWFLKYFLAFTSKMAVLSFDLHTFFTEQFFLWRPVSSHDFEGWRFVYFFFLFFWKKERHLADFSGYPKFDRYLLFILQASLNQLSFHIGNHTLTPIIELYMYRYVFRHLVRRRSLTMLTKFWPLLTYPMLTLHCPRIFFTVVKKNLQIIDISNTTY